MSGARGDLFDVMRDEHNATLAIHFAQRIEAIEESLACTEIKTSRRFVNEEQWWIDEQCSR
jgi:hypothetical protein